MSATVAETPTKTYYSRSANLQVSIKKGELRISAEDGKFSRIGEEVTVFSPIGASNFGCLVTKDPVIIEWMDKHIAELKAAGQIPDILTPEEYQKEIVPKDMQIRNLESLVDDLRRQISEGNRMTGVLKDQGKLSPTEPEQPKAGPPRPPLK